MALTGDNIGELQAAVYPWLRKTHPAVYKHALKNRLPGNQLEKERRVKKKEIAVQKFSQVQYGVFPTKEEVKAIVKDVCGASLDVCYRMPVMKDHISDVQERIYIWMNETHPNAYTTALNQGRPGAERERERIHNASAKVIEAWIAHNLDINASKKELSKITKEVCGRQMESCYKSPTTDDLSQVEKRVYHWLRNGHPKAYLAAIEEKKAGTKHQRVSRTKLMLKDIKDWIQIDLHLDAPMELVKKLFAETCKGDVDTCDALGVLGKQKKPILELFIYAWLRKKRPKVYHNAMEKSLPGSRVEKERIEKIQAKPVQEWIDKTYHVKPPIKDVVKIMRKACGHKKKSQPCWRTDVLKDHTALAEEACFSWMKRKGRPAYRFAMRKGLPGSQAEKQKMAIRVANGRLGVPIKLVWIEVPAGTGQCVDNIKLAHSYNGGPGSTLVNSFDFDCVGLAASLNLIVHVWKHAIPIPGIPVPPVGKKEVDIVVQTSTPDNPLPQLVRVKMQVRHGIPPSLTSRRLQVETHHASVVFV
eukprot:gnl/TRDRNA2_/TRDRNA2_157137_c2_seq1.p1 gnl/TRDRNA2_/TRDRNA2_157137_c2~~gnl/TRDRNA2_/TRDRNA2_157137_c2_seq1.p1  ORF type:complete len:565 (-),score=91.05 gnl/TRDRNA2_/TRDRNA2_157137_c2_seq1:129-1718(-)